MNNENFNLEKGLEIYNIFYNENFKIHKPFEDIFKLIFDGIKKYCKN